VECRGCSLALQRAMVDFGADDPFGGAAGKLKEHYGIEIPVSTVRVVTERHGGTILAQQTEIRPWPNHAGVATVITEMDGSMLPVVETAEPTAGGVPLDRRKTRQLSWKEVRLCMAHQPGSVSPVFRATTGGVEEAGAQWSQCVIAAGAGSRTKIHAVGDGASWISDQAQLQFGTQVQYLTDFYHLCDYLSAAADTIAVNDKQAWMEEKKTSLKENRWEDVLRSLEPALEPDDVADPEAPVRACHRYIANRSNSLDYKGALAKDLPIGSGEIESAHRYIFQKRLKISGAWWKPENLAKMVALRIVRANRDWQDYWSEIGQKAA
jgi:hypothetical protein